jgi:hypothetical protein
MTEVLLPTWIVPEEETHEWLDEGSAVFNAAFAPGIAQRQSFGGLRLKMSRRHTVRAEEKAQLLSILQATRGRFNALRTKVHFALRGSGLGTEILSNNTFANGTTGWTGGSTTTRTVSDRLMRVTRNEVGATSNACGPSSALTVTQYAPHVSRYFTQQGRGSYPTGHALTWGATAGAADYEISSDFTTYGLLTHTHIPSVTSLFTGLRDRSSSGQLAGDFIDISYVSLSRCPRVDSGLNSLLQSDEFDTTWTATRSSVDDQTASTTAPDGTATADSIIEDSTASQTHFVSQNVTASATAGDYAFAVCIKAGARTFANIALVENTGSTTAQVYANLTSGTVGATSVGANWSNARAFIAPLGDDWYYVCIVARKTNAATSIAARIGLATADGTNSYTGDGTSNIYAWRATLVQSGVPTRLIETTTTASTGTAPASGATAMHVKGLPASTNGLLLPGDWFEINGELKQCAAPLNSDAAGLGYLQFEPPLVRAPANDDPVIVTDPMGKFLVSNIQIQNEFGTQAVVTYDLEHIYE